MYIYQIERSLLRDQVRKFAHYISGHVLDVGGGEVNRYKDLFTFNTFTVLDITAGPEVDIVASADSIPLADSSKDSIISTQMLEHVKYPEKCVQEMYRVLKPNGFALITAPQWTELHSEPFDYWRYTNYGLTELFERNGFTVVEYEQRGGFFCNAVQMSIRYFVDKFELYKHPLQGRILSSVFHFFGSLAISLDKKDSSKANRKHAIGWCFVFQKAEKK